MCRTVSWSSSVGSRINEMRSIERLAVNEGHLGCRWRWEREVHILPDGDLMHSVRWRTRTSFGPFLRQWFHSSTFGCIEDCWATTYTIRCAGSKEHVWSREMDDNQPKKISARFYQPKVEETIVHDFLKIIRTEFINSRDLNRSIQKQWWEFLQMESAMEALLTFSFLSVTLHVWRQIVQEGTISVVFSRHSVPMRLTLRANAMRFFTWNGIASRNRPTFLVTSRMPFFSPADLSIPSKRLAMMNDHQENC